MSNLTLNIKPMRIYYTKEELERWKEGDRLGCTDRYISSMTKGTNGFGEYIAGRYFEELGYKYIHHDFNVFGGNKIGKYPKGEEIIKKYLGEDKYSRIRQLYSPRSGFTQLQEPDLLVYNEECTELIFVECKRIDTRDKLNNKQLNGLALLSILLEVKVYVCEIAEEGYKKDIKEIVYTPNVL